MSTRSRVGLLTETGDVESIYVHSDGYPEGPHGVGFKLGQHWTNVEDVRSLLALGDLSALGSSLGEDRGTGWFEERMFLEDRNDPRLAETLAYRRDRGEEGTDSVIHGVDVWPDYGQEFEYLGRPKDGVVEWSVREQRPGARWKPIA